MPQKTAIVTAANIVRRAALVIIHWFRHQSVARRLQQRQFIIREPVGENSITLATEEMGLFGVGDDMMPVPCSLILGRD